MISKREQFIQSFGEIPMCHSDVDWRRFLLLLGKPGTGKTSLITTIASKVDMDIAIITFGPKMDDTEMYR